MKRIAALLICMCIVVGVMPVFAEDIVRSDDEIAANLNEKVSIYLMKTEYAPGEEIVARVDVQLISEDGIGTSYGTVPDRIEGYDPCYIGEQVITVYYGEHARSFTITVKDESVPSEGGNIQALEIILVRDTYSIGEAVEVYAHGKVMGADGKLTEFRSYDCIVEGYDPYMLGQQEITVSYGDYSRIFLVNVIENPESGVMEIRAVLHRAKYFIGEETPEMSVYAVTADGMEYEVANYSITGYDAYTLGEQVINVEYMGAVCSVVVFVIEENTVDEKYWLEAYSNRDVYYLYEEPDITVILRSSNGEERVLTLEEYSYEGYDNTVAGVYDINIYYNDMTACVTVYYKENESVIEPTTERLEVVQNKEIYYVGDELNISVYVSSDGVIVKEVFDYKYEGYDAWSVGEQRIVVYWGNLQASFMIWVEEALGTDPVEPPVDTDAVPYSMTVEANREVYYLGEAIDINVLVYYTDGTVRKVEDYRHEGYDEWNVGEQTVLVYWGEFTCEMTIFVQEREAIKPDDPVVPSEPAIGEDAVISVSDAAVFTGSQERIAVSIANNTGIAGYKLRVRYDNTVLTPVSVEKGDVALSGITTNIQAENADLNSLEYVSVVGYDSVSIAGDGVLFYITFNVAENAAEGTSVVLEPEEGELTDENGDDVSFTLENGCIDILAALYGDANGDTNINVKDLVLISRYVSGYESAAYDNVFMKLADVYKDGRINTKDMVLLSRYLADWPGVELGKSAQ